MHGPLNDETHDENVSLRGGSFSVGGPIAIIVFGVVWIAISAFVYTQISEDSAPLAPRIMIWIFMAVGVAMIVGGVIALVGRILVNQMIMPASIVVSREPVRLGELFTVTYEQQVKKACTIDAVTLTLICREWVEYTSGTDTQHATEDVMKVEYPLLTSGEVPASSSMKAETQVQIPAEAMHTFSAPHNRISWHLALRTSLARWPDYKGEFPLFVEARMAPAAAATEDQS
ncbi:MAG: hypothetical protein JXO22_05725 [Phycisphaerae bacterium]|nr:hypothetical protein [Phycisphaerae bacterium]